MKQVIIVNRSLSLPNGQIAAHVAHAAVGATMETKYRVIREWLDSGYKKVVLYVDSTNDLLDISDQVRERMFPNYLVVEKEGYSALGVGPIRDDIIDEITGDLPLLP